MIGSLIMGAIVGWIAGKLMNLEGGLLMNIIIGVVAEGEGIPFLSLYVAEVEGEAYYENGIFTLENLHLLSNK